MSWYSVACKDALGAYEEEIFLILDNMGGHGKHDMIEEYTKNLKIKYNVTIVRQVLPLTCCSVLNLGFLRSLQSFVKYTHFVR